MIEPSLVFAGTINPKTNVVSSGYAIFNNKPLQENLEQMFKDGLLPPEVGDMFLCPIALLSMGYGNIQTNYGSLSVLEGDMIVFVDNTWKHLPPTVNLDINF
jgi:hypothetical protein